MLSTQQYSDSSVENVAGGDAPALPEVSKRILDQVPGPVGVHVTGEGAVAPPAGRDDRLGPGILQRMSQRLGVLGLVAEEQAWHPGQASSSGQARGHSEALPGCSANTANRPLRSVSTKSLKVNPPRWSRWPEPDGTRRERVFSWSASCALVHLHEGAVYHDEADDELIDKSVENLGGGPALEAVVHGDPLAVALGRVTLRPLGASDLQDPLHGGAVNECVWVSTVSAARRHVIIDTSPLIVGEHDSRAELCAASHVRKA